REYEKVCGLGEETVLFAECRQKGEDVKWKLHWIGEANKPAGYDDALPDGSDAAAAATETSSSIMFAHCPAQTVSALPESAGSSDTPSPSDSCPAQPAQTKTNGASGTEETKAKPTACTVKGSGFAPQAGICILVDNCNNKGQFGYPGFCPGDKNIRCCIKKPIATCALTKDSVHGIKRGTVGDCIETQVCYYQGKIPYAKSQGTSGCPLGANIECCIGLEEEPPQQSPVLAAAEPQTIIKAFFGTRVLTPNQFKEFKEKARSCNDRIMVGDAPVQLTAQAKNLWRAQVNYAEEKEKAKLLRYAALWKNILADNTDAMQGTLFDKYAGAEAGVVEAELKDLDFNSLEATGFAIKFVTSLGGGKSKFKPSSLVAPVLFETSNSVPAYISEVSKNDPKLNHYVVPINQKDYGDVAAVLEIQMPEEDALKALGYNKKDYKNVVPGTETNLVSGFLTQMDCVKGKMETPSIGGMRTLARDEPLERGECVKLPITDAEKALKAVSLMKSVKKNGESYHYAVDVLQACNALVPYYNQEFDVTAQVGNKIVLNSLDLSKKFLYDITLCAKKDACVSAKPIKASELIYGKGEKPAVEVSAPPATVAPEGESADETEQEGGPTGVGAASGPEKAPGPKALPEPPAPVEKTPTERQVESVAPRVKDVGLPPKAAELIAEGNPSVTLNKNVQLRLEKGVTSIGGNRAALYYSVMNDQFSQRAMYPMLGGYPGMFSPSGGWYGGGFGYNNLQAMLSFPFVWNPASMNALTTGSPFTYGGYNFYTPSSQFLALALGDFSFGYFKTDPYGNQGNFRALGGALSLGPGFSIAGFGAGSLRVLVKIDELQPGEEVTFVMVPPEGQEFTLEDAKALPDPIVEIGSVSFIEPPAVQEAEQPEKEVVPAATDYTIPAVLVVLVALVGYWWLGRK
ncbi:hypothetical protein HZC09_04800, partial [Candidatus Micrarchaeota archaeon]|nr:hypothetical protein [Candidatus Micrarchaeota archaeon]